MGASDKVVSLRGALPANGAAPPSQDAIDFCEKLLQLARDGGLHGIAIARLDSIGSITTDWCGTGVDRHFLLAGTNLLNLRVGLEVLRDDE